MPASIRRCRSQQPSQVSRALHSKREISYRVKSHSALLWNASIRIKILKNYSIVTLAQGHILSYQVQLIQSLVEHHKYRVLTLKGQGMVLCLSLIGLQCQGPIPLMIPRLQLALASMIHSQLRNTSLGQNSMQKLALLCHSTKTILWILSNLSLSTYISSKLTLQLVVIILKKLWKASQLALMCSNQL